MLDSSQHGHLALGALSMWLLISVAVSKAVVMDQLEAFAQRKWFEFQMQEFFW